MSTHMTIQESLAHVMGDVRAVAKSDRNTHQNFNFRGIDSVLNAVGPALRQHGVIVLPDVLDTQHQVIETANGKTAYHVIVRVAYTFVGPAGDSLTATVVGEAMDYGDKAVPKAMSVAFRTCLLQALALPTDEPDPDSETYERGGRPEQQSSHSEFDRLLTDLACAADLDELTAVAARVKQAAVSDSQRDRLRNAYAERRTVLS